MTMKSLLYYTFKYYTNKYYRKLYCKFTTKHLSYILITS